TVVLPLPGREAVPESRGTRHLPAISYNSTVRPNLPASLFRRGGRISGGEVPEFRARASGECYLKKRGARVQRNRPRTRSPHGGTRTRRQDLPTTSQAGYGASQESSDRQRLAPQPDGAAPDQSLVFGGAGGRFDAP